MHISSFLALTLSSTFVLFPSCTTARVSLLSHAHKVAIKHSSSLARDLRIALGGVLVAQPDSAPTQNVYCVSNGGGVIVSSGNGSFSSPSSTPTASGSQPATTSSVPPSPWKPIATYSGSNFFDGWTFSTGADPTDGNVQYVDQGTAQSAGLVEINDAGNAVMRVETTPTVQTNRMSVRITTNLTFTEGLVILDAVHMPTGCGTWPGGISLVLLSHMVPELTLVRFPAFWTNGPNWPNNGEIDIVEGVNNYTDNQATIHTGVGCSIPTSNSTPADATGTNVGGTDCSAAQSNNEGCGVRFPSPTSFGSGFNSVDGGVYASEWSVCTYIVGGMLITPRQCIGRTAWGLRYGIFRGVRYPTILQPAHHNHKTGPLPWHSGLTRTFVISPTCSRTTARYLILRFGRCIFSVQRKRCRDERRTAVIGPKVSGVALVYPDNQSVVSSKLDLRLAHSSYKRADHHSMKLVSHPPQLALRHSVDH